MPVTCPNCGRETERRRDGFCDGCGAFLGWDAGESAESQLLPQQAPQRLPPRDDQRAGVQIRLESDLIEVAPGNAASTAFTIKNLGTQVEEFRFFVAGPEWLAVEPATMSVYPGQEAAGAVQAAPPRRPGSAAGVAPFQLTVTSALHAHVSSSAAGRVNIAPYYELTAALIPTSGRGRGWTRHHIALDNRGNAPVLVSLNPTDIADGLQLNVPAVAEAPPGRVTEVPIAVHGSFRWFGRPEHKTFSVVAEAPEPLAPTRLPGTRIVVPLFPRWVPAAAAGLLAAGVAGAALIPKLTAHHEPIHHAQNVVSTGPRSSPTSPGNGSPTTPTSTPPGGNAPNSPSSGALSWTTPTSIATGASTFLTSVSCPTTTSCAAVDQAGNAFTFSSGTWSAADNIDPAGSGLTSVSCPTATSCTAVDQAGDALTFSSGTWSAFGNIDFAGGLTSVSCPTTAFCAAVDHSGNAVTFNGTTWSAPGNIDPAGNGLTSVSCPATTSCTAVDHTGNALTFSSGTWSAADNIDPAGSGLYSVSCPTATFCAAVDETGNALAFHGTTWSAPGNIDPAGGSLTSVSCPTATFCAAVDSSALVTEGT